MRRLRLLSLLLCFAFPLAAQDSAETRARDSTARAIARADSVDTIILDIMVDPAANERHVVFLQKGLVYRARFGGAGVTISMRSRGNRQLPFIVNTTAMADASGGTEYEIYPSSDGDIEFTPIATEARVPIRFVIWRDARATLRRRNEVRDGRWAGGVEVALGGHTAFKDGGDSWGAAGVTAAACLAFRYGRTLLGVVHGCAMGVEWVDSNSGTSLGGFFVQPRIRIFGSPATRRGRGSDVGLVLHWRFAGGSDAKGIGVYGARDFAPNAEGRGWRGVAQLRQDWVTGKFPDGFGIDQERDAKAMQAQVSVGYYW